MEAGVTPVLNAELLDHLAILIMCFCQNFSLLHDLSIAAHADWVSAASVLRVGQIVDAQYRHSLFDLNVH